MKTIDQFSAGRMFLAKQGIFITCAFVFFYLNIRDYT